MKKIYNNKTIIILAFILNFISCRAQTLPLNTLLDNIPNGAYVKDLNNELSPYVGTYKANFQGNEITLFITKVENRLTVYTDQSFYRDALVAKYIIKNSAGIILQDTQNNNTIGIELFSTKIRTSRNAVRFYYSGTNCGVGWGDVYLKKINATQISWEYRPDSMVLTSKNCPGNPDINVYLPVTKDLIFTKQ